MQNITVTRYPNPKEVGWAGYIEPADRSWIAFIGRDGRPLFFLNRNPDTGAVLSDDVVEHAADLREQRENGGLRTGMRVPDQAPSVADGPVSAGLLVQPLGEGPVGD
jgi:hypothetical protein